MSLDKPIAAAYWWAEAGSQFNRVVTEFLRKAKAADKRQYGHDCGHEWTITVVSRGHSMGVTGEDPPVHSDAKYTDTTAPVTVRAHNLRDALLLAAAEPLGVWFAGEEGEPT